jgi:hypothetical protein
MSHDLTCDDVVFKGLNYDTVHHVRGGHGALSSILNPFTCVETRGQTLRVACATCQVDVSVRLTPATFSQIGPGSPTTFAAEHVQQLPTEAFTKKDPGSIPDRLDTQHTFFSYSIVSSTTYRSKYRALEVRAHSPMLIAVYCTDWESKALMG